MATTLVASLAAASTPAAAASPEEAVDRGVAFIRAQQDPTTGELPGFGGDWSLTALAAAGADAATVGSPSAQDFYLAQWTTGGDEPWLNWTAPSSPDGRPATDYERALLLAHAAGLQPSRLSADQNLVAQLAGLYNGPPATPDPAGSAPTEGTFGAPALFNGTVFGLLALSRTAAPPALLEKVELAVRGNQHDDGGWTYQRVTNAATRARASDIDMTGAGLAALCDAGVPATDEAVQRAVAFLQSKVDPASGGFQHMFGINGDSAAWAINGLNACGLDAEGPGWEPGGKSPVDFLLSLQRADGSFKYSAGEDDDAPRNVYTTQSAVRALAGAGITADPVSVRPAPVVAPGTVVPQAVAVVAGGGDVRFCRAYAPLGATVLEVVGAAPCGAGVTGDWTVRLDGAAATTAQAVGLGELVVVEPAAPVPPAAPSPVVRADEPGVAAVPAAPARLSARSRGKRLALRVSCPAADGCRVVVLARSTFKGAGERRARPRRVAHTALTLAAGESRVVALRFSRAFRRELRDHSRRTVRLRAITRTAEGTDLVVRRTVTLRG